MRELANRLRAVERAIQRALEWGASEAELGGLMARGIVRYEADEHGHRIRRLERLQSEHARMKKTVDDLVERGMAEIERGEEPFPAGWPKRSLCYMQHRCNKRVENGGKPGVV